MLSRMLYVLITVSLFVFRPGAGLADEKPGALDYFRIGLDFMSFCDLKPGAPLSEACYAFMGAVIEMVEADNQFAPEGRGRVFPATCIPRRLKVPEIVEAIRQRWAQYGLICAGICTSTSYVVVTLAQVYPCKPAQ